MEAEESAATVVKMTKDEIEAEITKAMLARLDDFKQQAEYVNLTPSPLSIFYHC